VKRLLLLSIILLSACDRQIPFDEQSNNTSYLSCSSISDGNPATRWRNVILDKSNQSVRSEWYFIASDNFTVMQHGSIFVLNDNYDGSAYRWGEYKGKISRTFELHKTTLNLDVVQRIAYDSTDDTYDREKFRCNVYDDYQTYAKWETSILESLESAAIRFKYQSERTEENKQI